MNRTMLIIFALVIICAPRVLAQKVTFFTTSDGLVNNWVFSLELKTDDSLIWIGTRGGLSQFDAGEWTNFTISNSPLVHNKVNAILLDRDQRLWFGTDDGISIFSKDKWEPYTFQEMPAYIRARHITSLFQDSKGNIWIGTKGGGVTRYFRNPSGEIKWTPFDTGNSDIISDNITAIGEDSAGYIWFGTQDSGLCKFDGISQWTSFPGQIDYVGNKIHVFYKDSSNALWIGTNNGVFKTGDGTNFVPIGSVSDVLSIAEDREFNLWFGTKNNGLYKYDHISFGPASIPALENIPSIWSIILDHEGYLWLGTNGAGLVRVHLNWQIFNDSNSDLPDNIITGVAEDSSGNLWIATGFSGIARYDGTDFTLFNVDGNFLGTNFVNSIMVDNNDWIWCATERGAHGFDGNSAPWVSFVDSLPDKIVNAMIQDRSGNFWFATRGGVSRFDGTTWATLDTSDGLPGLIITSIFEDDRGHLWFGTSDAGVAEFVGDSLLAVYDRSSGLIDNQVTAIIQDQDFNYWFGTAAGIFRFDGENWDQFTTNNSGLTNNSILCLYQDRKDNIWVGTEGGGLIKFDGQFWRDFGGHFISDGVNAIFQDRNHIFWFGTNSGLVKYIPDRSAPETIITISPDSIIGTQSALFVFSGIDTETPTEKLVYSWSLKNARTSYFYELPDFTDQNYCEVYFPSNGDYVFSVKAKDADGNVDPTPAEFLTRVDTTPPKTFITQPSSYEIVSGRIPVIGTAFDPTPIIDAFKHYWLSYAPGNSLESIQDSDWCNIFPEALTSGCAQDTFFIATPVINDTLIWWNTSGLYGDYFLRLSAEDSLDHFSHYIVRVKIVASAADMPKDNGGLLGTPDQVEIYVPPGAMNKDTKIFLSPIEVMKDSLQSIGKIRFSAIAYEIGPDSIELNKPARLTVHYDKNDITGLDESKLSFLYLDPGLADLNRSNFSLAQVYSVNDADLLGGVIDKEAKTVQTTVTRLGSYILVEDSRTWDAAAEITEINCQPRIFSPRGTGFAQTTTISFKLSNDSKVSIKVYNLAGRLVRVLLKNEELRAGNNPIEWDGRDYNGNICPSDLYIVTIETEKEVKTKTVMILDRS